VISWCQLVFWLAYPACRAAPLVENVSVGSRLDQKFHHFGVVGARRQVQRGLLEGVLRVDVGLVRRVRLDDLDDSSGDPDGPVGAGNVQTGLTFEGQTLPEIFVAVFCECVQHLDVVRVSGPVERGVSFFVATGHNVFSVDQSDGFNSGHVTALSRVDDFNVRGCVIILLHVWAFCVLYWCEGWIGEDISCESGFVS